MTLYFNLAQKLDGRDTSGSFGVKEVKEVKESFQAGCRGVGGAGSHDCTLQWPISHWGDRHQSN